MSNGCFKAYTYTLDSNTRLYDYINWIIQWIKSFREQHVLVVEHRSRSFLFSVDDVHFCFNIHRLVRHSILMKCEWSEYAMQRLPCANGVCKRERDDVVGPAQSAKLSIESIQNQFTSKSGTWSSCSQDRKLKSEASQLVLIGGGETKRAFYVDAEINRMTEIINREGISGYIWWETHALNSLRESIGISVVRLACIPNRKSLLARSVYPFCLFSACCFRSLSIWRRMRL